MDFHRPLSEVLLEEGCVSEEKIRSAQEKEAQGGPPLGICMVDDGLLDEEQLARLLVQEYKLPPVNPLEKRVHREALSLIPAPLAERFVLLPLLLKKNAGRRTVYVAMADPTNLEAIESIEFCTGASVNPVVGTVSRIREAIRRLYGATATRKGATEPMHEAALPEDETAEEESVQWGPSDPAPSSEEAAPGRKGTPTRRILQAITEILIEKEIITKEELMSRVSQKTDGTQHEGSSEEPV
jgi:hypothetical protein